MMRTTLRAIKRIALGDADLPQQCTVGMPDPQMEVRVWLHGMGAPLDVTNNHVVACASPFTVGLGLDRETARRELSLQFQERDGDRSLLAKVGLRSAGSLEGGDRELSLFEVQSCRNCCLARARLWAYDLHQAFVRWRSDKNP